MNNPLVSIIIPVYNTEPYLEQCLSSLERQSIQDMEIILVNDGSTDRSGAILKNKANTDKRFLYIEQENQGISVARNKGLEMAKGTFVMLLDSDDWFAENCIEILCRRAEETGADVVIGNTISVYPDGRMSLWGKGNFSLFQTKEVISGKEYFVKAAKYDCYVPMVSHYLYRRTFLEGHAFRFEPGLIHEDELWTPQILVSAQRVSYSEIHHCYYREKREGSVMDSVSSVQRVSSLKIIIEQLFEFAEMNKLYDNEQGGMPIFHWKILQLYSLACQLYRPDMESQLLDNAGALLEMAHKFNATWVDKQIVLALRRYINHFQSVDIYP